MIAVWIYFFATFGFAQECTKVSTVSQVTAFIDELTCTLAKEPLNTFFKSADPCVSKSILDKDIEISLCGFEMGLFVCSG